MNIKNKPLTEIDVRRIIREYNTERKTIFWLHVLFLIALILIGLIWCFSLYEVYESMGEFSALVYGLLSIGCLMSILLND